MQHLPTAGARQHDGVPLHGVPRPVLRRVREVLLAADARRSQRAHHERGLPPVQPLRSVLPSLRESLIQPRLGGDNINEQEISRVQNVYSSPKLTAKLHNSTHLNFECHRKMHEDPCHCFLSSFSVPTGVQLLRPGPHWDDHV